MEPLFFDGIPYFVKALTKGILKYKRKEKPSLDLNQAISKNVLIKSSSLRNSLYKKTFGFRQLNHTTPIFPYTLATPLHTDMVADKNFPLPLFGLLHKKEKIKVFQKINFEEELLLESSIAQFSRSEKGIEFDLVTKLFLNEEIAWESITTAFYKDRTYNGSKKIYKPMESKELIGKFCPRISDARVYGALSYNIDPIHTSYFGSKKLGHKKPIIHGIWTLTKSLTFLENLETPYEIEAKFISPLYVGEDACLQKDGEVFEVVSNKKLIMNFTCKELR